MPPGSLSSDIILSLVDKLPVGILVVDTNSNIVFANYKAEQIFGYNKQELFNQNLHTLLPEEYRQNHKQQLEQYFADSETRVMDSGGLLQGRQKDGQIIQVQVGLSPVKLEGKRHILVTMIEALNPVLKIASYHDPLTGLANRLLFDQLSETLRKQAIRHQVTLTLLFLDLDNFKSINDNLGHHIGDAVLSDIATVLSDNIRGNDIVGRIGGDEFVICLYDIKDVASVKTIANKIYSDIINLNKDLSPANSPSAIFGVSIGCILSQQPAEISIKTMMKKADKLMYQAKNNNGEHVFIEVHAKA